MSCPNCRKDPKLSGSLHHIKESPIEKLYHGIVGIAQATLHLNSAPKEIVEYRREICMACPHRAIYTCNICSCFIAPKTALRSESCPSGSWAAVN